MQGSQISTHPDSYSITVGSAILNACFRDIIECRESTFLPKKCSTLAEN